LTSLELRREKFRENFSTFSIDNLAH